MLELLTYYVIGGALLVGAPAVFFLIAFMPALQNTKGRMVGYKDHKQFGDISSYENSPSDQTKFYLVLSNDLSLLQSYVRCNYVGASPTVE